MQEIETIKLHKPDLRNGKDYDIASNPEFLREGSAIEDFMRPDRVVCGVETSYSESILRELYRPLNLRETPILFTNRETAELIKYASNSFLATKITFINEIANLCEKTGVNVEDVSLGMGLDKRIGGRFLRAGPAYGGSCFPKDTKAMDYLVKQLGLDVEFFGHILTENEKYSITVPNGMRL